MKLAWICAQIAIFLVTLVYMVAERMWLTLTVVLFLALYNAGKEIAKIAKEDR